MRSSMLLGAVALAGAWTSPALAPIVPAVAAAMGIPRRLGASDTIALTFDDGPHPSGTVAVLEALDEASATSTFFLVGEQVERNRSLAREIVSAGHTVGLHGHRHRNLLRLTPAQFADDLERGRDAIGAATGVAPRYYRPPYGIFSPAGLRIVRKRGLRPLLWSRWGHDWRGRASPTGIAEEVSSGLRGTDVLLLHDADHYSAPGCWRSTVAALAPISQAIASAGLRSRAL